MSVQVVGGELRSLCAAAARRAGASDTQALVLAESTAQAEERGHRLVGVGHLFDYLDGWRTGRISRSEPAVRHVSDVVTAVDCAGGLAQHGFEVVADGIGSGADRHGLAAVFISNSFTAGELGYYVRALSSRGQMGVALANSPALMSVAGARRPVLGTNPLAFGMPLPDGRLVQVDQASSATAWVALRDAAAREEAIPAGWAVDGDGQPTTSAEAGLAGAMLPFGGYKGGNIAFLVELLATLAGGQFSSDAAPFDHGPDSPGIGVAVLAFSLERVGAGYAGRLQHQLTRWAADLGADPSVWIEPEPVATCRLPRATYERLLAAAAPG